jgi:hemoglobin/transferrin/lactoferrin receptor protein
MIRIGLTGLFFLFGMGISLAQNLQIRDQATGAVLPGVSIQLDKGAAISSNENGVFVLPSDWVAGQIKFSLLGYTPKSLAVDLVKKQKAIYLQAASFNTSEVVISANRFEQSTKSISQQVEVITATKIAQQNAQTAADLLQSTGNVNVQKSQAGGGSPVIRGFEANKVLIVVDGVRMNNAIFRGGHLQNVITVDQSMLERAEVLYGSASLMYGSDALGGVMHFISKDPQLSGGDDLNITGSAYTRYSSPNNERTGHIDLNIGSKKVAWINSFTYSDFDDLRQGKNRKSNLDSLGLRNFIQGRNANGDTMLRNDDPLMQRESGYSQYDFLSKMLFQQNQNTTHVINFQRSNSSNIPRYDRLSEINNTGAFNHAQWYYGPQERTLLSYQLRLKNEAAYDEANVTLAFQDLKESRHNRRWGSNNLAHRKEQVRAYSINADFDKMLSKLDLRYGMEATYNDVQSTAYRENIVTGAQSALDTRYPDGGSNTKSLGIYSTANRAITEKLNVNAGIRFSHSDLRSDFIDTTFFNFPFEQITQNNNVVTVQLGLLYKPSATWKMTLNLNTGFRSPNVDDLAKVFESNKGDTVGQNSSLGTIIIPNENLKAEKTRNIELGIAKSISEKWNISATGFYTLITDAIVTQNSTFNGAALIPYGDTLARVQQNVNAGQAYIAGINLSIDYQMNSYLSLSARYNYTKGEIVNATGNTPLDHIQPGFGRVGIRYQGNKFDIEGYSLFNEAKKLKDYNVAGEDNLEYATVNGMPAWYTLNVRASYRINSYFLLQAGMENILDRSYRVFASGINAAGRNVSLSLRATF